MVQICSGVLQFKACILHLRLYKFISLCCVDNIYNFFICAKVDFSPRRLTGFFTNPSLHGVHTCCWLPVADASILQGQRAHTRSVSAVHIHKHTARTHADPTHHQQCVHTWRQHTCTQRGREKKEKTNHRRTQIHTGRHTPVRPHTCCSSSAAPRVNGWESNCYSHTGTTFSTLVSQDVWAR